MAQTIYYSEEDVERYAELTRVLQLEDLEIVGENYNETTNTIRLYCTHRWDVGVCPKCGQICTGIHDYPKQRIIQDAPVRGCRTELIFDSVRLECDECGKGFTLPVRDVVPECGYTYRLARELSDPSRKQDVATLSRTYGLGYKTVESILLKAATEKLGERVENPIKVQKLGIDEISNKKGQGGYILVLTDVEKRILLDILPDRKKESLEKWLKEPPAGIKFDFLDSVAIDLWSQYKEAVLEVFPDARIVADRFHVVQNLQEAIHKERRKAQDEAKTEIERKQLKGLRYILIKNKSNLTASEKKRLESLKETHPKLFKLWSLRQELHDLYETHRSPRSAKKALNKWIRKAGRLKLEHLNKFCKTLQNWKRQIVNFFANRLTCGFVEGMNSKIRLFKRIAFGLPNFKHLRLRLIWACG